MSAQPPLAVRWPEDDALLGALAGWMAGRRWFPLKGGKAPEPEGLSIVADEAIAPGVRDLVVAVPRPRGPGPLLLHVPLVLEAPEALERYAVDGEPPGAAGTVVTTPAGPVALVDGPHHPAFWRAWAGAAERAGTSLGPAGPRAVAARAAHLRVTTGEQSNTSVVLPAPEGGDELDEDLIVKVFRVLAHGRNPDVEVSVALARLGWEHVRRPVAWSTLAWTDPATGAPAASDSAVACTFIPVADDGFELFCALAADDDADGPVRDRAVDLAQGLGRTTALMHERLARALGDFEPQSPQALAGALRQRADWARREVPALGEAVPGLEEGVSRVLEALEALPRLERASRVHGDYHLGQVLREVGEPGRWYVLDFEGEPLRPLAERSEPDQPLRDVAGMLRSFDYAAAVGGARHEDWLPAVRAAFRSGYTRARTAGSQPRTEQAQGGARTDTLLAALELDKALYEAVYEARNRPDWLEIPVRALRLLTTPLND
ncbi:MAG: phosphotransferase [Actinomyces sp.]|uniref:phosphotransferase n=1 Tax=Actinomyces sp. TaxID=29317 RepID=UPI0026DCCE8F|nr:phosphotransferase [Actinomyces sp.]MDO4243672.1 phosphotransferase [Actinomyces sp.]